MCCLFVFYTGLFVILSHLGGYILKSVSPLIKILKATYLIASRSDGTPQIVLDSPGNLPNPKKKNPSVPKSPINFASY